MSGMAAEERLLVRLQREALEESEPLAFVSTPDSGAVVLFRGIVRARGRRGEVVAMEYEAHEALARSKLAEIGRELLEGHAVERVALLHRIGRLSVGEASVLVAVSAAHRSAAFRAAERAIERIKEVVPIWKREEFADGASEWVPGNPVEGGQAGEAAESPPRVSRC